jgi:hypothetical protein
MMRFLLVLAGLRWDRRVEICVSPPRFIGHGPTPELLKSLWSMTGGKPKWRKAAAEQARILRNAQTPATRLYKRIRTPTIDIHFK